MATDLDILRHKEWLGLLQPIGLLVSLSALLKAQTLLDRGNLVDLQDQLLKLLNEGINQAGIGISPNLK